MLFVFNKVQMTFKCHFIRSNTVIIDKICTIKTLKNIIDKK